MSFSKEANISDKLSSLIDTDIMSSYMDMENVMSAKNIVPGSFRYQQDECVDNVLSVLDSNRGGIFTRVRLGPIQDSTHPSLNQIEWSFQIPANSLGIQLMPAAAVTPDIFVGAANNGADGGLLSLMEGTIVAHFAGIPKAANGGSEKLRIWLGYQNAALIANQVDICANGSSPGITSGNFNYQHSLISSMSLSDSITKNSVTITSIEDLLSKSSAAVGVILEIPLNTISVAADAEANDALYTYLIPEPITISGIIDLNQLDPILNNFPILTPGFNNMYLRFQMNNFLQNLEKACLNLTNPVTGTTLPFQMNPPEKPSVICLPYYESAQNKGWRNYNCRIINAINLNATRSIPNVPVQALPNVQFRTFRTRQVTFKLQDQATVEQMLRSRGIFLQPSKMFKSMKFNQTNKNVNNGQLQVQMSMANIDKMFVTLQNRSEYPVYLPTPTITQINPMWRNAPVYPSPDESLNATTAYKIFNAFVDVDQVSPPTILFDSIMFKNTDKNNNTPAGVYGSKNLFKDANGMFVTGAQTNVLFPNKFVYGFDLSGGNYLRGYNAAGFDYNPTSQFQFNFVDIQANGAANITTDSTVPEVKDQDTFANFINTTQWGTISDTNGTSNVHALCDVILKFTFSPDGTCQSIAAVDLPA